MTGKTAILLSLGATRIGRSVVIVFSSSSFMSADAYFR